MICISSARDIPRTNPSFSGKKCVAFRKGEWRGEPAAAAAATEAESGEEGSSPHTFRIRPLGEGPGRPGDVGVARERRDWTAACLGWKTWFFDIFCTALGCFGRAESTIQKRFSWVVAERFRLVSLWEPADAGSAEVHDGDNFQRVAVNAGSSCIAWQRWSL